jgi:hypothetical protein
MSRRSVPPRGRKSRNAASVAPPGDAGAAPVSIVTQPDPAALRAPAVPLDEAAAIDAGWDELLG